MKHLRGSDRVVVAFSGDEAWVLLVGPHADGDAAADVYGMLYEPAGVPRPGAAPDEAAVLRRRPAATRAQRGNDQ